MKRKKMFKSTQFLTVTFKIDMYLKKTIILATKFLPTCKHVFQTYISNVSKPRGHISVGNVFFLFFNYIYLKRFP